MRSSPSLATQGEPGEEEEEEAIPAAAEKASKGLDARQPCSGLKFNS